MATVEAALELRKMDPAHLFPIDELKIGRSFIMGLGSGGSAIVGSCIDLAHAVGIRAVAEGVETSGQVAALMEMGCDLAQGYHFARPLPAPLLKEWLDAHTSWRPGGY